MSPTKTPAAESSMVDALAADAKTAEPDTPPEYPDGAPKLIQLLKTRFGKRAEAIRRYNELQAYLKAHPHLQKTADEDADEDADVEVDPEVNAESYELLELMDQFMASVAVDPAEYEDWPGRVDVDTFMATWTAYQAEAQPGEASSSSS